MKVDPNNTEESLLDEEKARAYIEKLFGSLIFISFFNIISDSRRITQKLRPPLLHDSHANCS